MMVIIIGVVGAANIFRTGESEYQQVFYYLDLFRDKSLDDLRKFLKRLYLFCDKFTHKMLNNSVLVHKRT